MLKVIVHEWVSSVLAKEPAINLPLRFTIKIVDGLPDEVALFYDQLIYLTRVLHHQVQVLLRLLDVFDVSGVGCFRTAGLLN